MTTNFTQYRTAWNRYQQYTPTDTTSVAVFNHNFNITETSLEYKLTNVTTSKVIFWFNTTLAEFKAANRFTDQSWFGISNLVFGQEEACPGNPDNQTLNYTDFVSLLDASFPGKRKSLEVNGIDESGNCPVRIFVPYASGNFTNFAYQVACPDTPPTGIVQNHTITVTTNLENPSILLDESESSPSNPYKPGWKWFFAPITVTPSIQSPKAGEKITYTLNLTDPNSNNLEQQQYIQYIPANFQDSTFTWSLPDTASHITKVYVEPLAGYVNKTVVNLTNGTGSFTVDTSDLVSGDAVQFKIGYKLFTGVVNYTQTLG